MYCRCVREPVFLVPHDIFFKSINKFAPCCESYFYFLLIETSELLELTNQVALLKVAQLKIDFKKLSLEETHVW